MARIDDLLLLEKSGRLPPEMQADLDLLRKSGRVPPLEGAAPADMVKESAPTMNFDPWSIITAPISGIANIPSAIGGMVSKLASDYKTATIGSEAQQPKTLAEADKFYNQRAVAPRVKGLAEGIASGAALNIPDRFLPETTDEDRLAYRGLGNLVGQTVTGGLGYKALAQRAVAKKIAGGMSAEAAAQAVKQAGPTALQYLGLPAAMTAAEPLSRLDIPGAVESAFTGAGIGGLAKGAASTVGGAADYLTKERPARIAAAKLGGAPGIIKEVINRQTEGLVPNELIGVPGTTVEKIPIQRGANILSEHTKIAEEATRQQSTVMHDRMLAAAPRTETVPDPSSAQLAGILQDTDPAVQTTAMRKIAALGNRLQEEKGAANYDASQFAGLGQSAREAIAAAMGDITNEGATFQRLTKTYQNLNAIKAIDPQSERLLTVAKKAVEADINKFDKTAPEAVAGWHKWRQFYSNEVGARFGEDAPLGKLTKEKFGRATVPPEQRLNAMGEMEPNQVNNIYSSLRRGPGGGEAVDAVRAAHLQRFKELVLDPDGSPNPKKIVAQIASDPADSAVTRQWQALLGPDRFAGMRTLADELRKQGYTGVNAEGRGVLGPMEAFHVLRGGIQTAFGNPLAGSYHFITATVMRLSPELFDKLVSNRVGARLLAAGLMEPANTPRGRFIADRLAKQSNSLGVGQQFDEVRAAAEARDVTPKSPPLGLPSPVIQQPPPPSPRGLPEPGPGNRPPIPSAPLPDYGVGSQGPAAISGRAIDQAMKERVFAERAFAESPIQKAQLKRSLRSQQAAAGTKFAEEDAAAGNILDKYASQGPDVVEHKALIGVLTDKTASPILKDAARTVLKQYPNPVMPGPPVQQSLAEAPAVPPKSGVESAIDKIMRLEDEHSKIWANVLEKGEPVKFNESLKANKEQIDAAKAEVSPKTIGSIEFFDPKENRGSIVHASTKFPGQYQVTNFDKRGFMSDSQYKDIGEALRDAKSFGKERSTGNLDRLVASPEFQRGNELTRVVGLANELRLKGDGDGARLVEDAYQSNGWKAAKKIFDERAQAEAPHPADVIRARQAANEALKPKGRPSGAEVVNPVALMNRITKGGEKILVTPGEMGELRSTFGDAKARQWFSENGTQSLDDAISLFQENYGITADYNAWKAHLEDAFNVQARKKPAARRK